jgi:dTDP-4-amino-4,6-dideoxygalactose transaminase
MFDKVVEFEKNIAEFFGAPYAVATDSCTHALELCLRHTQSNNITVPTRTYISIPMTLVKLGLQWSWKEEEWSDYYFLGNTNIIDAAVLWGENTYIPDTFMCLSFQFRKHLNLGRGGMILLQNKNDYDKLKKMSYDGRDLSYPSWGMQDINTIGYHYYMTPEVANDGIIKLNKIKNQSSKKWTYKDYPYLPNMTVFKQ